MNASTQIDAPIPANAAHQQALTVLVVDDEAPSRMELQALIDGMGCRVVLASGGAEAVAAFVREQPDIVLMDVMMPGVDGFQATEYIRELSGDSFVPIIFVTPTISEAEWTQCVARGGNDVLSKPINPAILQAKIEAFSQLRRLYKV